MLQALVTLGFVAVALGTVALMSRLLTQDWDAVRAALGFGPQQSGFAPLPPHYRVNSRRATFVRMEAAPLRRAA